MFLSVVVPAHNEEDRLPDSLRRIDAFLGEQPYRSEIVVVENGSVDGTWDLLEDLGGVYPSLRALREPQRGKGLAVRRGMLEARGAYRFLCDADLSMPIEQVVRFLPPRLEGVDVAVGSREHPDSEVTDGRMRRLTGRVFNGLVRAVAVRGLRDTQCRFKCFRGPVAEDVFALQRLNSMAFDVEILYLARRRGYRISEVPITWRAAGDSKVRLFQDSVGMAADLFRIRRWHRGTHPDEP
ncbi:MAG: glycosyltransferase family 2 protein [Phycisphaerae bacterium]|nr:glycosyltransferase family 2 protein [Phycisphaerae bacterium]